MPAENAKKHEREQARPCPVCGETMVFKQVLFNTVDICEDHGIWLDKGELESIISRLKRSGRRASYKAAREGREEGRIEFWLLGPLSFLFDRPRKKTVRPSKRTRKQ
jgi:Zn-finger nucleic acid-binding protein